MTNQIIHGDCLEKLKDLPENSIDSIVTDPPYELGFMGKSWDNTGIANNPLMWAECLRVLKPGGYLLSFGGTRTYHRMASAIEDAGFEVRDMIEWVYGSGFPKSLNIGKAVDKINGKPRPTEEFKQFLRNGKKKVGLTSKQIDKEIGTGSGIFSQHYIGNNEQIEYPTKEKYEILKKILKLDDSFDYLINWAEAEREIIEIKKTNTTHCFGNLEGREGKEIDYHITLPATEEAKQWEGWGTALKPAHEPICMARKPLEAKTVAENVLKYGTGGINIDESRVEGTYDNEGRNIRQEDYKSEAEFLTALSKEGRKTRSDSNQLGRFPANLIHDNSEEVRECFPETKSGAVKKFTNNGANQPINLGGGMLKPTEGSSGNASRFFKSIKGGCKECGDTTTDGFDLCGNCLAIKHIKEYKNKSIIYQAKASKSERNKGCEDMEQQITSDGREKSIDNAFQRGETLRHNNHPTVKPIALMEYLIKMVTQKGGIVLDPFAGSGSTLVAAKQNGYQYIGIEMTEEYIPIIKARLNND